MNKKNKNEEVSYISDNDKLYIVQRNKVFNTKKWLIILIALAIILLPLAESLLIKSLDLKKQEVIVEYNESGDVDYKVYLKENKYYKEKYLEEGMEYVANLISTINPDFRYELHATDTLDFTYKYSVRGKLLISKDSESQPLYTKDIEFVKDTSKTIKSNSFTLAENLIIDYDEDKMTLSRTLQASIPLSEQTIKVSIDTDKISNNGLLFAKGKITISNVILFVASVLALGLVLILLITSIRIYIKFKRRNIYYITLGKYISEYDKLIINGSFEDTNIDENKFDNIIKIEKFEELVDAAENLSLPILVIVLLLAHGVYSPIFPPVVSVYVPS